MQETAINVTNCKWEKAKCYNVWKIFFFDFDDGLGTIVKRNKLVRSTRICWTRQLFWSFVAFRTLTQRWNNVYRTWMLNEIGLRWRCERNRFLLGGVCVVVLDTEDNNESQTVPYLPISAWTLCLSLSWSVRIVQMNEEGKVSHTLIGITERKMQSSFGSIE